VFLVLRLRYVIATPNLILGAAPLRMTSRVLVLRLRYVIATPNLISGAAPLRMTRIGALQVGAAAVAVGDADCEQRKILVGK
jgi:hypothetical protein